MSRMPRPGCLASAHLLPAERRHNDLRLHLRCDIGHQVLCLEQLDDHGIAKAEAGGRHVLTAEGAQKLVVPFEMKEGFYARELGNTRSVKSDGAMTRPYASYPERSPASPKDGSKLSRSVETLKDGSRVVCEATHHGNVEHEPVRVTVCFRQREERLKFGEGR